MEIREIITVNATVKIKCDFPAWLIITNLEDEKEITRCDCK